MKKTLKQTVLSYILDRNDEAIFSQKVTQLAEKEGDTVYQNLFELLAGIDIPLDQSAHLWERATEHQQELTKRLGRKVDLTTTLSDYLQNSTDLLHTPRLIEAGYYENIVQKTVHDKLTGLYNRAYFDQAYSQQISLAKRYQDDFSLLFLDIDNFKDINDTYGHQTGDAVLREIGRVINAQKRDSDIAARYGGEEIILLLTHTDNISGYVFAERLRQAIEDLTVSYQTHSIKITVSGGIASYPFNSQDPEQLLQMADSAVYLSKGAGKNKISHFKEEKRRYLRVKINQPVLAKELDFSNSQPFSGTSKDICVGGILFENENPLPLGALIKVKVPVNEGPPIMLIGTVVRVEAHENGCYDIGMTTSFKEMDKIANIEIGGMLRSKDVS